MVVKTALTQLQPSLAFCFHVAFFSLETVGDLHNGIFFFLVRWQNKIQQQEMERVVKIFNSTTSTVTLLKYYSITSKSIKKVL